MKNILVTGGAGYIGSHVTRLLAKKGFNPIVYDNLSGGFVDFVKGFEFIEGDIGDFDKLLHVLSHYKIECVMNFASYIAVGESVQYPLKYYENNVAKTLTLFEAMIKTNVKRFIFSSSAAVYGNPEIVPIPEESKMKPESPYGKTKYFIEEVLKDLSSSDNFSAISLRYFNAAGADESGEIGESHVPETHLIPLVIRAVLDPGYTITIFGTDYNTPDGTCIRDYIHVNDLGDAHILALEKLLESGKSDVFNLGNGRGFSVKEVIDSVRRITGKEFKVQEGARRPGDPAVLVASSQKAKNSLNWQPRYTDIDSIVASAWKWESQKKRKGY
ncbi:MAG: UDP-glucose 4-epimerase GalE [Spirochaetes bacterium]|nr:UDP-glucose 4-epimerase GalE [Spirochaetota bacterium]